MPWGIRIRGELHTVEDKPNITLGRSDECDIQVQSRSVDQKHAEMVYVPEKKAHFVKDLRSVNGTFINERRLSSGGSMEVKALDIVKLGYDMNVLRIEELPTKLPSQRTEGPSLHAPSSDPSAAPPVSAPYVFSPAHSTLPQHAQSMSVQYFAIQPIQQSPTQAPLLPAAQSGVSYVPMTYYMPVGTGGVSGVPVNPSTVQQASTSQHAFSYVAPPTVSSVPSLTSDQLLLHHHHHNYLPLSSQSGSSLPPTHPHANQTQERLFHPVSPGLPVDPPHGPPATHQLKQTVKDASVVGELTMALIDLDSDTEVGAAPSGEMHLAPRGTQRGRMPNFDSDVSSNFTSVSNQEENELGKAIAFSSSLQMEDSRRTVVVSKSPTSRGSNLYGHPVWTGQEGHMVRSRSSSTNSEDVLGPNRRQRAPMKRGKRAVSSATYDVRSTDDGFSAEDEGSDSNIDNRTAIVSRTETRSTELTITLPEVPSERPDTAQTLVASSELPSPMSTAMDETDTSLCPPSASSNAVPQGDAGGRDTPSGSSVDGIQQSFVGATTSWNISFDDENDSRPKGRRSMPGLTSLTKRLPPATKPEAKSRKSFSPATGASRVGKGSTTKGTLSSNSPRHSLVSNKRQVDAKANTTTLSGSALKGAGSSALKGAGSSALKGAGSSAPGRRTPQGQTGARKEVVTKPASASTVNTPQKKASTKTEATVSGKGQRSSSPFTRNTSDRRTYTKRGGAAAPDLPRINAEENRRTSASKQATPKSHGSHVTSMKRGLALAQRPLTKEQARKGAMDKKVNATVLVVDVEHKDKRPALHKDESTVGDLSPRKVVGEEDAAGTPSDCKASPAVEEEGMGEPPSVPSGVDSLIVAAHFGEVDSEAPDGGRVPHEEPAEQGRLCGVGGSALFDEGVVAPGSAGGGEGGPAGTSCAVSQTPTPNLSTPAFGPATSSPKEPLGTATLTEWLSPLALELEDTPTRSSPAIDNHTEVVGVEKGRVSSARRQWQKSKTPGLDGLVLASMGALSEQVSKMADISLDQLMSLRTDMEVHGVLPAVECRSDTTYSFEIERSDQPPTWMASHQELAQVFRHLQETEKKLKELNQLLTVMSKRSQFHTEHAAVAAAGDSHEQLEEEQVHSVGEGALENGSGEASQ